MSNELTKEEKTNIETKKHISNVKMYIEKFIVELKIRSIFHDMSKTVSPELEIFTEYTPKLAECTYGSDEYKEYLKEMRVALDHHYKNNRHHPEHFKNGIDDMNFLDIIEMFCDWKAASLRHNDGDIKESIKINSKRFNISEQLVKIFENSVSLFD